MNRPRRIAQLGLLLLVLATCVGCDQAAKLMAQARLSDAPPVSYLNGLVRLEYAENSGAFLSLGSRLPPGARFLLLEVMVGSLLAIGLALTLFSDRMRLSQKAVLALALGGGLGNLIDRVARGVVVDFVSLGIGPLRTGIFNFADVAITLGMLGVFWLTVSEPATTPAPEAARGDD